MHESEKNNIDAKEVKPSTRNEFLLPGSILLAGVFIGAGLYFGFSGQEASVGLPASMETTPQKVERLGNKAGVKTSELAACMESDRHIAAIESDVENAIETGGTGTPWSIIVAPSGRTYPLNGAMPVGTLEQMIEIVLADGDFPEELIAEREFNTDAVAPVSESDWIKGDINAPITIIEYSDVDCPFCSRFHQSMIELTGKRDDIAWVYRHFPLEQLHPEAKYVAEAAECVGEIAGNNAFWQFIDTYFSS